MILKVGQKKFLYCTVTFVPQLLKKKKNQKNRPVTSCIPVNI